MEEFVDEYLIDGTEDKILEHEEDRQSILEKLNMKPSKKSKKKKADGEDDDVEVIDGKGLLPQVKRCAAFLSVEEGEEVDEPKKKKAKISEEDRAMGEAYMKFEKLKNDKLKDILSWNNVVKTGPKSVLLTRVIDGYLHGRIGKCVVCKKGQPKISDDGTHIICSGYFDKDMSFPVPCGSKRKIKEVQRYVYDDICCR